MIEPPYGRVPYPLDPGLTVAVLGATLGVPSTRRREQPYLRRTGTHASRRTVARNHAHRTGPPAARNALGSASPPTPLAEEPQVIADASSARLISAAPSRPSRLAPRIARSVDLAVACSCVYLAAARASHSALPVDTSPHSLGLRRLRLRARGIRRELPPAAPSGLHRREAA